MGDPHFDTRNVARVLHLRCTVYMEIEFPSEYFQNRSGIAHESSGMRPSSVVKKCICIKIERTTAKSLFHKCFSLDSWFKNHYHIRSTLHALQYDLAISLNFIRPRIKFINFTLLENFNFFGEEMLPKHGKKSCSIRCSCLLGDKVQFSVSAGRETFM